MNKEYYICLLDMIQGLTSKEKQELYKMDLESIKYYYHMQYLATEEEIKELSYL